MKDLRSNVGLLVRVFLKRYFLFVLNGFLLAASLFFFMQDRYEHEIFRTLARTVKSDYGHFNSEDSLLVGSLRLTYYLEEGRHSVFGPEDLNDGYADFLRPLTYDLMTAKGACGSYSLVLAGILTDLKIPVRFAQMKVNGVYGGHILIEAQTKNGWVVLDPSFNLSFKKPGGGLANFDEVKKDWSYYKQSVPSAYRQEYAYEGVRYTNWEKIPVVSSLVKKTLNVTLGKEKADKLSLRGFFMRKFLILFFLGVFAYLYSWYRIVRRYLRNRHSTENISTVPPIKSRKERVYKVA